jgi:hypothetical protein
VVFRPGPGPEGSSWRTQVRATPPAGPVAQGLPHGAAALGRDDHAHVSDSGRGHGLQDVKQDARLATGMSCLALVWVRGLRRVPRPPARMRAFKALPPSLRGPALPEDRPTYDSARSPCFPAQLARTDKNPRCACRRAAKGRGNSRQGSGR